MRLTVTSPDGLGDFILRLPWLLTMEEQGWELQLIARAPTLELAKLAGLRASGVEIANSPYNRVTRTMKNPFAREFDRVRDFRPDMFFFGPSQLSFFEEEAVDELRDFTKGGFCSETDFRFGEGLQDPREVMSRYDFSVAVDAGDPEAVRNAKAARFLLRDSTLPTPAPFRFPPSHRVFAASVEGTYLATAAGQRSGDRFAGWGDANWSRELSAVALEAEQPFVFVGVEKEQASHAAILKGLPSSVSHRNLTGQHGTVEQLLRVLAGAEAYVGKDGGVMHLAAALGKPVLAVFGGGHWPRFLPVGTKSVILAVRVPCRGCDWRCHLDQPACVRDLAHGSLVEGWKKLREIGPDECHVLEQESSNTATGRFAPSIVRDFPRQHLAKERAKRRAEREHALKPFYLRWVARRPPAHV